MSNRRYGEVSERFKELVLKTSDTCKGTKGSNPFLSANTCEIQTFIIS